MIELEFLGGAATVTGSKHLVRTSRATVLLECGLFQGHRAEANQRNRSLAIDSARLDAVVLSHAHLDHSGALPVLAHHGYRGPIYATPATRDLCAPMLEDAANIQLADARHIDRLIARGVDLEPVTPLYDHDDVVAALELMIGLPYHRRQTIAPGVDLSFLDAGHVLGSAIVVLDIEDDRTKHRLAFTGDLGRPRMPILRDPEIPEQVDHLTDVFRLHPDCYDRETFAQLQTGSLFEFDGLRYVTDVEDSKAIDAMPGPAIVIAGSGMCEGGRVLHHLRALISDPRNTVAIVGFQAEHTLGRRIAERRPRVKIFGIMHDLHAEVVVFDGFSAHADQPGLVEFCEAVRKRQGAGTLSEIFLVHGEPAAQAALSKELAAHGFSHVTSPRLGERIELSSIHRRDTVNS